MDRAWQIASSAIVVGQVINMITHPEKILFPEEGITKGEFAAYHEMIAPFMLPHLRGRPITMERYHRGIGADGFFQKDVVKGFPEWLERVEVPKKDGKVHHPIANDARSLNWLANQNSITIHVWASRVPKLYYPDICIFDLDPSKEDDAEGLRSAALSLRELLVELGLPSWVKTSGSKGFHIAVPLDGKANYGVVARFAHGVGRLFVKQHPDTLTLEFKKVDRAGRLFVDTGRNDYSATFAATYTVRAKPGAPVSAPCSWEEVESGMVGPRSFTLRNMEDRVSRVGDLWADLLKSPKSLKKPIERLTALFEQTDRQIPNAN
jgi:bifunctional non-homologous end joining protein LigD